MLVRKLAYFVELVIKRLSHVGGEILLTPASMECTKVEELEAVYRCYFEQNEDNRAIIQEFEPDDLVRAQTFNIKEGAMQGAANSFYWRYVVGTGDNYIDLSKTDCATGSSIPAAGDHIVQLGNRNDPERQNAIILSTVGDDAPSIKQYKGINGYELSGKEVTIISPLLNKFIGNFISISTGKSVDEMLNEFQANLDIIWEQTDKEYTIWFFDYDPTPDNIPASEWATDAQKVMHEQDMFYNRLTGHGYRFEKSGDTWVWNDITDHLTLMALENAAKAQDTADGKRRVFVEKPTDGQAYDIGDLWTNAVYAEDGVKYDNDTLVCKVAKAAGEAFSIEHWQASSTVTTTYIKNMEGQIEQVVASNAEVIEKIGKLDEDLEKTMTTQGEHATRIVQTEEKISLVSGCFNEDGSLNTSGLVTEANMSTMFVKYVDPDGKFVKRADISAFFEMDEVGNFISVAKISADKIELEGYITDNKGFSIQDGKMIANGGVVGGWNIENNGLSCNSSDVQINVDITPIDYIHFNSGQSAVEISSSNISRGGVKIHTYSGYPAIEVPQDVIMQQALKTYGGVEMKQGINTWDAPGCIMAVTISWDPTTKAFSVTNGWQGRITNISLARTGKGKYKIIHNLGHNEYVPMAISNYYANGENKYNIVVNLLEKTETFFTISLVDDESYAVDGVVYVSMFGRN